LDRFIEKLQAFRSDGQAIRDWSVYQSESRRLSLGTKDRQTGVVHAPLTVSEGCGARYLLVWTDGRISRGSLERRQLDQDADTALAQARSVSFEDPDSDQVQGPGEFPEVDLCDNGVARLAGGEVGPLVRRLAAIRRLVEDGQFKTWSGSFGGSEASVRLRTSRGLDLGGQGTSFGWHATLNGEIGDGFGARTMDTDQEFAERLDRLSDLAQRLGVPGESPAGGVMPVLMHPNVVENFVLGTLLGNLQGSTVVNGEGYFRKEQFGSSDPVLRSDLNLRLDPLVPMKSGSYRFTSEGVPAGRCNFIEFGRLVRPVLNLKYARRFGGSPTPVPTGMDTLHLEGPPELTEQGGYDAATGGVLVLSVLGAHTQDASSGDFSLSAPQALGITGGKPAGRLRGTLSGNLFDLLRSEDLTLVRFEGEHTPGLLANCRFDPK
jgi:PmbA protein